jgi:hypothetical protein
MNDGSTDAALIAQRNAIPNGQDERSVRHDLTEMGDRSFFVLRLEISWLPGNLNPGWLDSLRVESHLPYLRRSDEVGPEPEREICRYRDQEPAAGKNAFQAGYPWGLTKPR